MGISVFIKNRCLAISVLTMVLANMSYAQTTASVLPKAPEATAPAPSAFKGYKPYTDEAVVNWKAANDTTAHIGGWREYAKQAQQPDNTPAQPAHAGQPAAEPTKKAAP